MKTDETEPVGEKFERRLRFDRLLNLVDNVILAGDWDKLTMEQLRSLWTAYCLEFDIQCDTLEYDNDMADIMNKFREPYINWDPIENRRRTKAERENIEKELDIFFGAHLC